MFLHQDDLLERRLFCSRPHGGRVWVRYSSLREYRPTGKVVLSADSSDPNHCRKKDPGKK